MVFELQPLKYIHTGRQTYIHTGRQTDRQTDRQGGRQAGRQTDRRTCKDSLILIHFFLRAAAESNKFER